MLTVYVCIMVCYRNNSKGLQFFLSVELSTILGLSENIKNGSALSIMAAKQGRACREYTPFCGSRLWYQFAKFLSYIQRLRQSSLHLNHGHVIDY